MAGGPAHLLDAEQDGVQVAIQVDGADPLDIAALFAFAPEFLAAAAVVDGPAGGHGLGVALGVHVGEHQDFARLGVLGDGGQQAVAAGEIGAGGR